MKFGVIFQFFPKNIYPYVWVPHTFDWGQALIPFVTPQSSCQQYCLFLSGIKLGKTRCLYLDIQLTYKAFHFSIPKQYENPRFASPHLTAPMPVHVACASWSLQFPFGSCFYFKRNYFFSLVELFTFEYLFLLRIYESVIQYFMYLMLIVYWNCVKL